MTDCLYFVLSKRLLRSYQLVCQLLSQEFNLTVIMCYIVDFLSISVYPSSCSILSSSAAIFVHNFVLWAICPCFVGLVQFEYGFGSEGLNQGYRVKEEWKIIIDFSIWNFWSKLSCYTFWVRLRRCKGAASLQTGSDSFGVKERLHYTLGPTPSV